MKSKKYYAAWGRDEPFRYRWMWFKRRRVVLHFKNIAKACLVVLLAVVAVNIALFFLEFHAYIDFLIGMLASFGAAMLSMAKWDLWHFE